jgi:Reverse transcriptase (RNA-dependent DNA polymerase)
MFHAADELSLVRTDMVTALVYVDDVVVFARSFDELTVRLKEVLDRIREAGLKLKSSKCHLYKRDTFS